jgi:hypothetical protein
MAQAIPLRINHNITSLVLMMIGPVVVKRVAEEAVVVLALMVVEVDAFSRGYVRTGAVDVGAVLFADGLGALRVVEAADLFVGCTFRLGHVLEVEAFDLPGVRSRELERWLQGQA